MSSRKKTSMKITPKKKLPRKTDNKRQPPKRAQPSPTPKSSKNKPGNADVVKRLQDLIQQKNSTIEQLTERINTLAMKNKTLENKLERLEQSAAAPKKNPAGGSVDTGPSQKAAGAALGALLGGHVKHKKKAEDKVNKRASGVDTGPSSKDAAASLGALFAKKKAPPKKSGGGGVGSGPSQKAAGAALGALFAKKKAPPKKSSGGGGGGGGGKGDMSQYTQLFKKYEMMMKLGINVHGAVGRMRQDGLDKKAIAAFEKKHNAYGEEDEKVDPKSLGLRVKKEVPVSKGIKMKRLHWDPTNVKLVKGSIWEDLDESNIRYDRKHFELHFQVRQRKPVDEQKVSKQQAKAGQIITFVSKKRTQGVLIGLKNLGLENEQLRTVLHDMDETVMSVDTLSKLLEMAPTMDEQTEAEKKIMQEGTRRVKDYGTVEQFFFTLCDFYNLHQRLKLWMFKQNFFDICDSLLDQYKTIGKACDKIRNNKNLRLLLTIILTFGNHMNSGTRKGQVYGFDLTILNNLTAVKSFDNTRSLSMYIYEFCDRKYPSALKILDELRDTLKAASSMEIETLKQAYERIQANMKEIKNLITSDEIENYDMDDRFIMVLTKFHKRATPKMKKFNMTVGNVMVSTKRVMKKFSYGSEQTPQTIESFFQIWWKFVQDFSTSKEKLILLEKERQKRIAKRKKMRDKQMKKKMHNKYKQNKTLPEDSGMQKGSTLHKEFEKRRKFDEKKGALHGKLRGHVKQRSIFIANGGKIDDKSADVNNTMRRLSSMYQDTQSQAKAMEDARKKAAILKYNKFKLPNMNQQTKRKWNIQEWEKQPFNIPDSKPMVAPKGNPQRNTQPMPNGNKVNKPNYSIKPKKNGGVVPPPPSGPVPPHQQQQNNNNYYGNNPQASWANQQQQLGYGSNPNLSYQQYQQQQQQPNNSYQQQQRQQYGMQNKQYYNAPYKR